MEKYVTSLEISKKLKELGVKQESEFWYGRVLGIAHHSLIKSEWTCDSQIGWARGSRHYRYDGQPYNECDIHDKVSAYLTDELLEMLPRQIEDDKWKYDLKISRCNGDIYYVDYCFYNNSTFDEESYMDVGFGGKSLPDALGKMLIYLIENKLIALKKEAGI